MAISQIICEVLGKTQKKVYHCIEPRQFPLVMVCPCLHLLQFDPNTTFHTCSPAARLFVWERWSIDRPIIGRIHPYTIER